MVQAASEGCGGGVRARGGLHCGGVEVGKKKHEISHYKLMRKRVRAVVQAASEGCGGGVRARGGLHCGGVEDGKKNMKFLITN